MEGTIFCNCGYKKTSNANPDLFQWFCVSIWKKKVKCAICNESVYLLIED